MNKETRQFIWGLVLLMTCGLGVAIHCANIINGTWKGGTDYFLFAGSLWGAISGAYYIIKTT